jgi:hypothetical protein
MANPTVPFSWQMPEPTDLVTNLPADFEVFGQAVATDLQYLLGGTTGQVLAKASGTDLDFVWSADAAGMTNPMTTTSDMIYSSSGSTPDRIGIGSNGDVLTVTAGVPGWATPSSGGMTLLTTVTLSGASVTSSTFSSTGYKRLYMFINQAIASTVGGFRMRINGDTAANYSKQGVSGEGSAVYAAGSNSQTAFNDILFISTSGSIKNNLTGTINIDNPTSTSCVFMDSVGIAFDGTDLRRLHYSGIYQGSAAVTNVTFLLNSGTFTSGTIEIYGVN